MIKKKKYFLLIKNEEQTKYRLSFKKTQEKNNIMKGTCKNKRKILPIKKKIYFKIRFSCFLPL